ncbi:glutathione S-transferase family protein [Neisseriaceae bacterium TC5R-5]|nr:glutathione S-transferase family protein [Neisseriaceae bacterium TC5R-5]
MSTPTLYGNPRSGHSYKVRLALQLAAIEHNYVCIDLSVPRKQRPTNFRAVSRFGEVPVLVVAKNTLCQSNAILQWLAEHYPKLAVPEEQQAVVREWLSWESNRIGFSVSNLRYSLTMKAAPTPVNHWLAERACADLDTLNQVLSTQKFLAGQHFSIADIANSAYLWWLADAGLAIADWPNVQSWLARIAAQQRWQHPDQLMIDPSASA